MKARLVWLILCGIWGSTWLFIKLGLEDLPPLTFAGIRFVISCAILFPLVWVRHLTLPKTRSDWFLVIGTGVLRLSRPRQGSAIGAVTPEREKRQAAVDSIDALVGAERLC